MHTESAQKWVLNQISHKEPAWPGPALISPAAWHHPAISIVLSDEGSLSQVPGLEAGETSEDIGGVPSPDRFVFQCMWTLRSRR